jgi:FtsZ-interacting cell division protein ZipA
MTSTAPFWLAAVDPPDLVNKGTYISATTREWIIIFGAITLVTLVVVGWAVFVRKRKDDKEHRHHKHHHHHQQQPPQESESAPGEEGGSHRRRKWRRRRREHRPRNPTLAETGGLPPIRNQGSTGQAP